MTTPASTSQSPHPEKPLFIVEMNWGQQPVRLTAWPCRALPPDAPTTSVHVVALFGQHVLLVRDRKGIYGFPGGRLDPGETREQAMDREVYEEANAYLEPDYTLYAVLKIEYRARVPGRSYPHEYSYMGMYAGKVRALDPFNGDPAGIILERALFTRAECEKHLLPHDRILLQHALNTLQGQRAGDPDLIAFLGETPITNTSKEANNGSRPGE